MIALFAIDNKYHFVVHKQKTQRAKGISCQVSFLMRRGKMKTSDLGKWAAVCSLFLVLFILSSPSQRVWAQTTQNCLECHKGSAWLDNGATPKDVNTKNATSDYLPLNLSPSSTIRPFYDIKEAY